VLRVGFVRPAISIVAVGVLALLQTVTARPLGAQPLSPGAHGDFSYYTFALTWQPGICETDAGCTPDQPRADLIGLHGLWPSLPRTLSAAGVTPQQWWRRGCDDLEHSAAAPALDRSLLVQLDAVMPHFAHSLLRHEYDKHVQCFHFAAPAFFRTELRLRQSVMRSSFGRYLVQHAGRDVAHADLRATFRRAFVTPHGQSLQLQCGRDPGGGVVLTQLWITIPAAQVGAFPQPAALMDAPIAQDTCPPVFHLPRWADVPPA
jgi:ribonuclease I